MMKHVLLGFWVIALFSGCASAQKSTTGEIPVPPFIENLPGPPALSSAEEKSDHDTLYDLQKTRTQQECARAASEVKISLASYYGKPYGMLSKKELDQLTPFFQSVNQYAWTYIGMAKKKWKRLRPYDAYADLHPCISKESSFSYPSGHSAMSRYYYEMLRVLYPERAEALLKRSDEIAKDRTIGGVHYPTDIRDGKLLGEEIFREVVKTEHLDQRLEELKQTLKH